MIKSLYAILNVSPDADPAVIEAAYKALMKKYHPDAQGGVVVDERRAAEINHAFYILRNPERRAEYDAQAQAPREALRMPPPYPLRPQELRAASFQPPPARAPRSKWATLMLIAALSALVYYVWLQSNGGSLAQLSSARQAARAAFTELERGRALPPVKAGTIESAVSEFRRIKDASGLMGLAAFSQDCFAKQSRSSSLEDFDFCIAFDDAAVTYDAGTLGSYGLPKLPRFEASQVAFRHAAAGKLLSNDEAKIAARLEQIRAVTAENLVKQSDRARPELHAAQRVAPNMNSELREAALSVPPPVPAPVKSFAPQRSSRPAHKSKNAARPKAPPPAAPRRQQQARKSKNGGEADFIERQGYIY